MPGMSWFTAINFDMKGHEAAIDETATVATWVFFPDTKPLLR